MEVTSEALKAVSQIATSSMSPFVYKGFTPHASPIKIGVFPIVNSYQL